MCPRGQRFVDLDDDDNDTDDDADDSARCSNFVCAARLAAMSCFLVARLFRRVAPSTVFFTAFVASNVLMVAKAGKLKGTRFSHAERRFTRIKMKRKDRLQIVALAVLSLFVGFSMFLHAKSQEDLFWKGGGTYPTFVPWFYTAATVGFYFVQFSHNLRSIPLSALSTYLIE